MQSLNKAFNYSFGIIFLVEYNIYCPLLQSDINNELGI
jgi:hypothetical protein